MLAILVLQYLIAWGVRLADVFAGARLQVAAIVEILQLISGVGMFFELLYLQRLTLRIPDFELSRQANILKIAFPIGWAVASVEILIKLLVPTQARAHGVTVVDGIADLAAFFLFGLCLMLISLLTKFSNRMAQEAGHAEQTWARPIEAGAAAARPTN